MKIISRKEFLTMPKNTLFSKYEPCSFGSLTIKGSNIGNDFLFQQISDAVDCDSSNQFVEILDEALQTGKSFNLDFECEGRDALFDENQLFAIWEKTDVEKLINRLKECI